jgi:solute:Na+ symporter, SSS family
MGDLLGSFEMSSSLAPSPSNRTPQMQVIMSNKHSTWMISTFAVAFLGVLLAGSLNETCFAEETKPETAQTQVSLEDRALETIRQTMRDESRWTKVHAAEYLLWLDYPQDVKEVFVEEFKKSGDEPEYRIGIWRVMAQATFNKEQAKWGQKIREVYLDTKATDRGHAAETLSKLRYKLNPTDPRDELFRETSDDPDSSIRIGTNWTLANSGEEGAIEKLAAELDSEEPKARFYACYALRHLPKLPPAVREKLLVLSKTEQEPDARMHAICAAAVHYPDNEELYQAVLNLAKSGNEQHRYQATQTLGSIATDADLPFLDGMLDDPSADVRATAGFATLRVVRRHTRAISWIDWTVICTYMIGMVLIGFYYALRTKSQDDYLLGGRTMKPWAVGLSFFATILSTISYLSYPGETIKYGPLMVIGATLAYPFVYLTAGYLMIPFIMRLKITSAYELLETRLGLSVRLLGSTFFLLMRLFWMAVIIFATTDKVLVPLLGLDPSWTLWLCAILCGITMVYTSLGGLRAVVVTDVIQTVILFGGAFLTIFLVNWQLGGISNWIPKTWPEQWPEIIWGFDATARLSLPGIVLAQFVWWVCMAGSDQMAIQRYLATRDAKSARKVLGVSLWANLFVGLILLFAGLALMAFFKTFPNNLPDGQQLISDADALFARFIALRMPPGVSGIVIAGLLAAAMSSLSSGVNSSCSVITSDFIDRFRRPDSDKVINRVSLARWISVAIGIVVVALTTVVGMVEGNLMELAFKIVNLLTVPLFGLFFMAMFIRWATSFGTICGAVFGVATVTLFSYWSEITGDPEPPISWVWAMTICFFVQSAAGMLFSLPPIGRRNTMAGSEEPKSTDSATD